MLNRCVIVCPVAVHSTSQETIEPEEVTAVQFTIMLPSWTVGKIIIAVAKRRFGSVDASDGSIKTCS